MNFAARSDTGRQRKRNEDAYLAMTNQHGHHLFAVCDGIGGLNAGEVASCMTVDILRKAFETAPAFLKDYEVSQFLERSLNKANDEIYAAGQVDPVLKGMGTTCVGMLVCETGSYIFNVGDSRLYAQYEDGLIQMSLDHSLLAQMLREKKLTPDQMEQAGKSNRLTNALGVWKVFRVDINKIQPEFIRVLICSDGLSSYVPKGQIVRALNLDVQPQAKADILIDLANQNGGLDNCTVIVIENDEKEPA